MQTMVNGLMDEREMLAPRVLIADDQPDVLEALRLLLKGQGYKIATANSPSTILETLAREPFDLLLMDLNYARDTTSGREGLDLLGQLEHFPDAPPIVVMTGWGTVGLAVETMQRGVGDFVEKPWENNRLLEILRKQIQYGRVRRETLLRRAAEEVHSSEMAHQLRQQEQEIEEARKIQQGFLPKEIPQVRGYEISAAWQPAHVVGGDYFDAMKLDEDTLALCIADVAGKGMPAALLMSNLQATVRGLASMTMYPEELCVRANHLISQNIAEDRFITFFYGLLDAPHRTLRYANAGHNPPVVLRRDGECERLRKGGGVLGIFAHQTYDGGEISLESGDRVVLFTDGVTEALNGENEEFGEERLLRLLSESHGLRVSQIQEKILGAVGAFTGGNFQDDATLMILAVE
jgi:sigma-B regulation protein RsbU (phosphoserine phosphatase)